MKKSPFVEADLDHWLKMPTWTLREAVLLFFDLEPRAYPSRYGAPGTYDLPACCHDTYEIAKRHVDAGNLQDLAGPLNPGEPEVNPAEFIRWALKWEPINKDDIPDQLRALAEAVKGNTSEEYTSLKPFSYNDMKNEFQKRGVEVPSVDWIKQQKNKKGKDPYGIKRLYYSAEKEMAEGETEPKKNAKHLFSDKKIDDYFETDKGRKLEKKYLKKTTDHGEPE